MADLCKAGGNGMPPFSDPVVTEGHRHRIGLLSDGTSCMLLVDEQEVARAEQAELQVQGDILMIGSAMVPTPAAFFTGLIDDVRIYSRAVKP